jgi:soluble lytic murein transglycosylase
MSASARDSRTRSASSRGPARRRAGRARRRVLTLLAVGLLGVLAYAVLGPTLHRAVREVTLPLRHEDIIRQQARDKRLNPALIAGVIFAESKFRDQTSSTGAKGLMQIQPETAKFIAQRSGGTRFQLQDLGTPQINISYGSFYLRYLLDHYGDNEVLALAAYNGGETNVDRWLADSGRRGRAFTADQIPFAETRAYVRRVEQAKHDYGANYRHELGL